MTPANQLDFGMAYTGTRKTAIAAMETGEPKRERRREATTHGFATAARAARRPMESAAAKRGIAEARLISSWVEIVGPSIASVSRPLKVRRRRAPSGPGGEMRGVGDVLVLAVSGASATELEFFGPQIIERVNRAYGYGAISELAFTQAHGPLPPLSKDELKPLARLEDLSEESRDRLQAMTQPVEDDALRDALTRLGANVMRRGEKSSQDLHRREQR